MAQINQSILESTSSVVIPPFDHIALAMDQTGSVYVRNASGSFLNLTGSVQMAGSVTYAPFASTTTRASYQDRRFITNTTTAQNNAAAFIQGGGNLDAPKYWSATGYPYTVITLHSGSYMMKYGFQFVGTTSDLEAKLQTSSSAAPGWTDYPNGKVATGNTNTGAGMNVAVLTAETASVNFRILATSATALPISFYTYITKLH